MSKVIGDVCVSTGSYKDNNGQDKTRFTKLGVLVQSDKGNFSIHLDAVPVGVVYRAKEGDSGIWLSVFAKQERQERPSLGDNDEPPF